MARYNVAIHTDAYQCMPCSKNNWEPGTVNDFMIALNGWKTTEHSLKEVRWRLMMFQGNVFPPSEWVDNPNHKHGLSNRYVKWEKKRCNTVRFFDRLCGFERKHLPSGYGWMQGYLNIEKILAELKQNGIVEIPFQSLYDIRQYNKCMDGCYMKIIKA